MDRRTRYGLLALLAGLSLVSGAAALETAIVFVQEPASGAGHDPTLGSRLVRLDPDGTVRVLTEGFAAAADPCVSFDGEQVLFAARSGPGDSWDIWEMMANGSRKTRITRDLGNCREPTYLPRAAVDSPNFQDKVRWITFTSTAPGVLNDQADGPLTSLYATNLEPVPGRGTVQWRTTLNLGGDVAPTLLSDGRVLHSARQRGAHALMAISWAGENLNPLYGSHDGPVSQFDACELPDRRVVFVETEADRESGGRLASVSLRRPLHSHAVLDGKGRYRTPHVLPDGSLVVAWADGETTWGLWRFDTTKNRRVQRVHDDDAWHDIDGVAIAPRPIPPGRIPTVEFASVLDVGSLRTVGQLQCMNVYESDRPEADGIEPGSIAAVRLVQGLPRPGAAPRAAAPPDSTWPPRGVDTRSLGEAPVEADGSFYVNVAGDVPFYLETLDADGGVVQTMRAWTWVRAGDQRGCIGCHEDKELSPVNRATDALVRARPMTLLPPVSASAGSAHEEGMSR